jgi:ADP-heptose:LPS heptosyltransferase
MSSLERVAKRGLIRLVGPLFPARNDAGEIGKILLVRVDDRLGNLILLTPTLDWLRRIRPDVKIGIVLSSAFAAVYANDPRVDELLVIDKGKQKALFPLFFRDLGRVGAGRYDAALECSNRSTFSFNSALYARASRAARRVGFANDLAHHYLTREVTAPEERHAAWDPLLLAGTLLDATPPGIEECRLTLHLPEPSAAWRSTLDGLCDRADDRIVGIHVGGRGRKRWPTEQYAKLADRLLDAGFCPWVFRGPLEADADSAFAHAAQRGLVLVPRAEIVQIGQAFARCRLVIAPDTGPMHLASAVGTRTLALFLNSDVDRYRPLNAQDRWIDARGEELGVDRVQDTALSMLDGERAMRAR